MKKFLFIAAAFLVIAATSCEKGGRASGISVNVTIDESAIDGTIDVESYTVTLTNTNTGLTVTAESENGIATATGVVPGLYSVYVYGTANVGTTNYVVSGGESNVNLSTDGQSITVDVTASEQSALIFKEIYYTGCTYSAPSEEDPEATDIYFRDQFYEIYNNSEETVYVDGLCIAETIFANYDFTTVYDYQIANPEKYVFVQTVWQIPGTGTQYPVKPGESIVIAQWGTNHKAESLTRGGSPVDLTGAEFEALEAEREFNGITLTDNAAINMTLAVNTRGYTMPQWLTSTSGSRYVIFKPSITLRSGEFITASNDSYGMATAHEIPIEDVIDAVETVSGQSRMSSLGLPTVLDAGAIWCTDGESYTGQSISRKISGTVHGRVIYQDTNNTTNDFEVNDTPEVRRNGAGVPSWNTWIQ